MATSEEMILVRAYPRLHLGLVDLGNATPRRYGGAGLLLNCLPVEVSVERGPESLIGLELLDRRGQSDIMAAIERMRKTLPIKPARVTIRRMPPQHVGLGTKTALTLALLRAREVHSDLQLKTSQLQRVSGRGGVSGVGIHGFFKGGFIVDAGHIANPESGFVPSSYREDFQIPPLAVRTSIPKGWRFALFLPPGHRYSGAQELSFFRSNTPLTKSEVKETIALVYHGIIPAVVQGDIGALKLALRATHRYGFKRRELQGQTDSVRRLFRDLDRVPECAIGMSSMGPVVYAVMRGHSAELLAEIESRARRYDARLLAVCAGRNRGHEVVR
jgi:beta-ribofuranosylaminobenzene 5'-phosphate synthase